MSKQSYFFANWKMYLDFDEANILANAIAAEHKKFPDHVKMAIFPNALSLYSAGQVLNDVGIAVGGQNVFWEDKGGYTGEISATMYKAAGCEYALVGHSERRHQFHETNHEVRQKMQAILEAGLTPVLCVGETKEERVAGKTDEVIETQLRSAFHELSWPAEKGLIVAYEPVWAIGTGEACDPNEAERLHALMKKMLNELAPGTLPILLYGGSVRPENVFDYLKQPDINGVLVGGAATKLESFMSILSNIK
ncbi:MAG: triose-phosphate isomerase [Candidatus Magasanikbacteria bacterium RIFOXYD2_FULL_41_14]|uniref:Triosephosphate isomerase n=1 Tax=Candidatus Magasanikbacteria bacterium RIFOXYD2_FULL_41_14 TaxID=1798709 RepID=A0A1F6PEI4_9BACT|nr:MAG: triose-phosphate isomerase [Candidatus Magasanikbacteria bacterium RIFOXYD2_FULL_41_14]